MFDQVLFSHKPHVKPSLMVESKTQKRKAAARCVAYSRDSRVFFLPLRISAASHLLLSTLFATRTVAKAVHENAKLEAAKKVVGAASPAAASPVTTRTRSKKPAAAASAAPSTVAAAEVRGSVAEKKAAPKAKADQTAAATNQKPVRTCSHASTCGQDA